jgi:hypothetical protein
MATYKFTTPVVEEGPSGGHRLFYFFKLNRGLTVVKTGGVYSTGRWYTQDELDSFDEYYLGGHEYTGISEVTKAALIAGGIDVTEANFVAE